MIIGYAQAIYSIKENASFSINDDDLDNIIWHDDNPTNITKEQILTKHAELVDIENNKPHNIKKASGKQKLKDLGLDDDEINALMGV